MSFGGGGGGAAGITAHKHNSQAGEGGPLQAKNDVVTGSSIQYNGGTETVLESLTVI